ncbi:MAG TPA: hypothetical protein VIM94_12395 [Salegentibacter sp.]|uniref:hypothetical protein n=1 Tax=Salegentibacter sp. TaxID=1903072 RepID=UPI002F92BD66
MNKFLLLFFLSILFFSCELFSQNKTQQEEGRIISLLIDELAMPLPVPPPPPKDGTPAKKINIDSLEKVKVRLIVDTTMFQVKINHNLPEGYNKYKSLKNELKKLPEKSINKDLIESKKGHHLIFGASLDDYVGKYSQMVTFSRISFNSEFNKAVLLAGHKTHERAGFMNLYLLRKENGKWKIIYKKNVEVS